MLRESYFKHLLPQHNTIANDYMSGKESRETREFKEIKGKRKRTSKKTTKHSDATGATFEQKKKVKRPMNVGKAVSSSKHKSNDATMALESFASDLDVKPSSDQDVEYDDENDVNDEANEQDHLEQEKDDADDNGDGSQSEQDEQDIADEDKDETAASKQPVLHTTVIFPATSLMYNVTLRTFPGKTVKRLPLLPRGSYLGTVSMRKFIQARRESVKSSVSETKKTSPSSAWSQQSDDAKRPHINCCTSTVKPDICIEYFTSKFQVSSAKLSETCNRFKDRCWDNYRELCPECHLRSMPIAWLADETSEIGAITHQFLLMCHNPYAIMLASNSLVKLLPLWRMSNYFINDDCTQALENAILGISGVGQHKAGALGYSHIQLIAIMTQLDITIKRMDDGRFSVLYCHLINLVLTLYGVVYDVTRSSIFMSRITKSKDSSVKTKRTISKSVDATLKQLISSLPALVKDYLLSRHLSLKSNTKMTATLTDACLLREYLIDISRSKAPTDDAAARSSIPDKDWF